MNRTRFLQEIAISFEFLLVTSIFHVSFNRKGNKVTGKYGASRYVVSKRSIMPYDCSFFLSFPLSLARKC